MNFFDFLEKIRRQPKHIRVQILVVCVSLSMAVIVGLWVASLRGTFSSPLEEQKASISEGLIAPFKQAKKELPSLKKAFGDLLGAFSEEKASLENSELFQESQTTEDLSIPEVKEETRPAQLPLRP